MADVNIQKACEVFNALTSILDSIDWKYEKVEDKLLIKSGYQGDDLPIRFGIEILPQNQVIRLVSYFPFDMPEDKRVEAAVAVCAVNNKLIDGCFDLDLSDGSLSFRMTDSYSDGMPTKDFVEYVLACSLSTIDDYNDKFFMLAKGMMNATDFLA